MHKLKSIDLNLLTALDALLTVGSVTGAAEVMHLSTPAMSHTLARIRDALGDAILVRAGRRLVPTARAVELREPLRRLLEDAKRLIEPAEAREVWQLPREFVVRAPEGMAIVQGAALLAAIRTQMPAVTLRFVSESASDAAALRDGLIDLDIGAVRDHGREVHTALLMEQRIVAVVRAGHALQKVARITRDRFAAAEHIAIARQGRTHEPLDRLLADAGCARRIALTLPTAYGALMAAARSDLVACAPEPIARSVAADLGLVIIQLPIAIPPDRVVQAWHPRLDNDPAHQWLRHCVSDLLKHET